MPEGYISNIECAGGCGILMTQAAVDAGRRYIYGHKGGCPPEGEPVQKRHRVMKERAPKPGPVEHFSYEKTLAVTRENLKATMDHIAGLDKKMVELDELRMQCKAEGNKARESRDRLEKLVWALESVAGGGGQSTGEVSAGAG